MASSMNLENSAKFRSLCGCRRDFRFDGSFGVDQFFLFRIWTRLRVLVGLKHRFELFCSGHVHVDLFRDRISDRFCFFTSKFEFHGITFDCLHEVFQSDRIQTECPLVIASLIFFGGQFHRFHCRIQFNKERVLSFRCGVVVLPLCEVRIKLSVYSLFLPSVERSNR